MSHVIFVGLFGVANGRRVQGPTKASTSTSNLATSRPLFVQYDTAIQCRNGDTIPATIRTYSHPSQAVLPDNTVVYLTAKGYIAPLETAHLDAMSLTPIPGDANSDTYEDHIPDLTTPFVFILGNVSVPLQELSDGTKIFSVSAADYVREGLRFTTVQGLFDTRPRWAHIPHPLPASCVGLYGTCDAYLSTGILRVCLDHIALNARPHDPIQPASSPGADGSPSKKRKFAAIASTSTLTVAADGATATAPVKVKIEPGTVAPALAPPAAGPSTPAKRAARGRGKKVPLPDGAAVAADDLTSTDFGETAMFEIDAAGDLHAVNVDAPGKGKARDL